MIGKSTIEPMERKEYLNATEAAALLGVRKQTLYAYVSRGLVRSLNDNSARRTRLYLREDLDRIKLKAGARLGHEAVAATAMNLGAPIVPSSITEISADGPLYRNQLAVDLVRQGASFEQTAELLWTGLLHEAPFGWSTVQVLNRPHRLLRTLPSDVAHEQFLEVLALVAQYLAMGRGLLPDRLRSGRTLEAAREVIVTMAGCFGLLSTRARYVPIPTRLTVAEGILHAMGVSADRESVRLLNAVLVLMADHELSPGTLAARVAASAGASLHSCLSAALSASAGTEVARLYDRADRFLYEASSASALLACAEELLAKGMPVPGFDHPVYPKGDPRARCILDLVRQRAGLPREVRKIISFVDQLAARRGIYARHGIGLIAACRVIGLPPQSPAAIFVMARTAGWVAHIQEQRLSKSLLRPRAKFVG